MFKTEFTIGTISGLESVTTMFRKPLCAINCVEWRGLDSYSFNQVPFFLPKKFFWKNSNIQLTISEIISSNSYMFGSDEEFINASIYYQDNSEQEILECVIEMTDWYENNSSQIYPSLIQESFLKIIPDRQGRCLQRHQENTMHVYGTHTLSRILNFHFLAQAFYCALSRSCL
jgi:putative glycosyltransferase (TIGR04372 family)